MKQKFIVMTFTVENWNDMRRFNYSARNIDNFGVVYPGFKRPKAMRSCISWMNSPTAGISLNGGVCGVGAGVVRFAVFTRWVRRVLVATLVACFLTVFGTVFPDAFGA